MAGVSIYPSSTHFGWDFLLKTYFAHCSEVGEDGDEDVGVCCHQVIFPRVFFSLSVEKVIEMLENLLVCFPGLHNMDVVGFDACDSRPDLFLVELRSHGYVPRDGWIRNEYYQSERDVWIVSFESIVIEDCLSEQERCVPDIDCHIDSDDDLGCVPLVWTPPKTNGE